MFLLLVQGAAFKVAKGSLKTPISLTPATLTVQTDYTWCVARLHLLCGSKELKATNTSFNLISGYATPFLPFSTSTISLKLSSPASMFSMIIPIRKVFKICEALVFQPEDIQVGFVSGYNLIVTEFSPSALRVFF
jgi:hypothetical protein